MAPLSVVIDDMQHGLPHLLDLVRSVGEKVAPRGMPTLEVRYPTVTLTNPAACLATGIGRKMNTRLASLEALQVLGGVSDPSLMRKVAPNTAQFLDGGSFGGAYGPRSIAQMEAALQTLRDDPDSRQAIVEIWDARYDLYGVSKDKPCTLVWQFMVRSGALEMRTVMRSNDCWWGVTYDIVMFTQVQQAMAAVLGLNVGDYVHQPGSLHIYERDLEAIFKLTLPVVEEDPLYGIAQHGDSWRDVVDRARALIYSPSDVVTDGLTPSAALAVRWHAKQAKRWSEDV